MGGAHADIVRNKNGFESFADLVVTPIGGQSSGNPADKIGTSSNQSSGAIILGRI